MQKEIPVPEGYTLLHEVDKNDYYTARYMNASNELLTYTISPHQQKETFYDTEHHTIESTSVSTVEGIFLIGEAGYENMLTWSINGYDYSIVGFISLEEMKKMLEVNQWSKSKTGTVFFKKPPVSVFFFTISSKMRFSPIFIRYI